MAHSSQRMKRPSSFSTSALSKHPVFSQFSQLSQQVDDRKPHIYFVVPPGEAIEKCANLILGEMFQAAEAHCLNVMWINDEECKDQELQIDGNIFIFDPFGSPGFEYLMGKLKGNPRVEILSPMVLRKVFSDPQEVTFQTGDSPTYTLAMKNMIISLSGFKDKETKNELETLVRWMNGSLSSTLTKAVTHVITANALTPKCIEAHKEGIPIMLGDWVRQVWKDNQSNFVCASDPPYVKFLCPTFHNVNVCMSQITAVKKNTLKAAIEKNGGHVSSELVKKITDVLVVQSPNGDKFKFAQKWNVPCVSPQWVEMSLERGQLLPPGDYKLVQAAGSTPVSPGSNRPIMISTPAHSILMPEWDMTRCSAIMGDDNRMVVEASKANFTRTHTEIHEDAMSQLNASENGGYLDGCKIYLVEYEKCDELKRVLNKSAAVRMNQLCEGVTHVIVNGHGQKLSKSIMDKIKSLASYPYIVTIDWILQSAKDGVPADEDLYRYEPVHNTICQETVNAPPASNMNLSSRIGRVSATTVENPQILSKLPSGNTSSVTYNTITTEATVGDTRTTGAIVAEFRSKSNTETDGTSARSTTSPSNTTATSETEDSDTTQDGHTASEEQDQNDEETSSAGLLVGLTFKVVNSDKSERKYIEDTILENGGSIVQDNATVAILQPICSSIEKDRAEKSYTKYWLFECLDCQSLDVDYAFYHMPLASFKKMEEILHGVVVAFSQFSAPEREYLMEIIKALGARYQDVFARKDSADGKNVRSTHLICKNMDTDKAKAARKWDVPIVVSDWITESCAEKKRLDEDKYDPAQVSTADERTVFMPTPQRRRTMKANNINNNMSTRSVYPPSTQKAGANAKFKKKGNVSPETVNPVVKETTPPREPQPSTSKAAKPGTSRDEFRAPPAPPRNNPVPACKPTNQQPEDVELADGNDSDEEDSFFRNLPKCPSQKEIDDKMAELKADFPYTEESYDRMLQRLKDAGVDLDNESSFSPGENERLCDPCPDSPLLLGLPRHESRALKEQFEIALNRSINVPNKIKVKTPVSTPLSEIVKRFNNVRHCRNGDVDSPSPSPRTSTPKTNLLKVAAINRLSQGNLIFPRNESRVNEVQSLEQVCGIRKLRNKRPSDGSPEDEEPKSSKRPRKSSDEDSDNEEIIPRKSDSPTPNGNHVSEEIDNEKPSTSKKPNRIQVLTDLIAENHPNATNDADGGSPIKRRSGDQMLVPCDEVPEEIERPHLSWVENDEEQTEKKSTVKRANATKQRIVSADQEVVSSAASTEPKQERETRKRSSRIKKTSSVVNLDEGGGSGRVTRNTRARSASKTRDEVPIGHQPVKISDGKRSLRGKGKKKATQFPVELQDNPMFLLSSLDAAEKSYVIKTILALGGSISKLSHYDNNCHAVITSSLLRSEKVLGCVAAGKYILKPEYIHKSEEAGNFLPIDEEFLWHEGNIKQEKERDLAQASFGWLKLQMEDPSRRPMVGMKFFFIDQAGEKGKAFERLILAGGGEIVNNIGDATCVIKDEKNETAVPKGVLVVNPMYLNTLILTVPQS